jgi:hypothetical protein
MLCGTKYHLQEYREGPMPRGKMELFNFAPSSLRNVIEPSFGILKMKWRILLNLPSYPMAKQSQIIITCMAIHNFIRDSALANDEFDRCDQDENYVPEVEGVASSCHANGAHQNGASTRQVDEDQNMNQFQDWIVNGLLSRY